MKGTVETTAANPRKLKPEKSGYSVETGVISFTTCQSLGSVDAKRDAKKCSLSQQMEGFKRQWTYPFRYIKQV